jgi:hypothetical protein
MQHAFKIDITQITYKNKVCKHTRFTNTLHTIQHIVPFDFDQY